MWLSWAAAAALWACALQPVEVMYSSLTFQSLWCASMLHFFLSLVMQSTYISAGICRVASTCPPPQCSQQKRCHAQRDM